MKSKRWKIRIIRNETLVVLDNRNVAKRKMRNETLLLLRSLQQSMTSLEHLKTMPVTNGYKVRCRSKVTPENCRKSLYWSGSLY